MKTASTTISDNQITIYRKPTPIAIRFVLLLLLLACLLIPILVTAFALSTGIGIHIGVVISFALFWGSGFFLSRVFLWNNYGKEIISLRNKELTYVADYRLFKVGLGNMSPNNLRAEIIYEDTKDNPVGRLKICNDTDEIETVLRPSLTNLEEIKAIINERYSGL